MNARAKPSTSMRSEESVAKSIGDDPRLQNENFNASEFLRERLTGTRQGEEARKLRALRSELSAANSAANDRLKKNVFQHYRQFIESSKEISHLEREVYDLASLLAEQKQNLEGLMSLAGDDGASSIRTASSQGTAPGTPSVTNTVVNNAQTVMAKMDGMAAIINQYRGKEKIILQGEMMLLDGETHAPIMKAMLVLLHDRLVIGAPAAGGKYSVESSFPLANVAAVNVKDREAGEGQAQTLLRLLVFPENRYYRCETPRVKKLWLEEIEKAKRAQLHEGNLVRQATIRGKRRSVQGTGLPNITSPTNGLSAIDEQATTTRAAPSEELLAWLSALPAELDDCIAHRDLDHAVELILDWKNCEAKDANIDSQLAIREQQIVQLLSDDVRRPGAVHGGPRAMKRARNLLAQLGRGTYAVDLYLKRRATLQRAAVREVQVTEEPLTYVRQLTNLYSVAVKDVLSEFQSQPAHYSQVLEWCSKELCILLGLIKRHVIEVAPTLAVLARTWGILLTMCSDLAALGVDLTFEVHRLLADPLRVALNVNFGNLLDSVRLRISEEKWRPYSLESESALNRLLEELSDLGLAADWAVQAPGAKNARPHSVAITQHACQFARVACALARDLAPLRVAHEVRAQCDELLTRLWNEYLTHLTSAAESQSSNDAHTYSTAFVVGQVLPQCEATYAGEDEESARILTKILQEKFPSLNKYTDSTAISNEDDDEEVAHV